MALRARIIRMWMEMHLIFLYIYIILAVAVFNNKFNNLNLWTRVPSGQASGMRQGRGRGAGLRFGGPLALSYPARPPDTRPCPALHNTNQHIERSSHFLRVLMSALKYNVSVSLIIWKEYRVAIK